MMATFRITAPDGGVFDVTAPDDASEQEVMEYARSNAPKAAPPAEAAPLAETPATSQPQTTIAQRTGQLGQSLLAQSENTLRGAAQGVSPHTGDRTPLGPVDLQDDAGNYYFKGADGATTKVDLSQHNVLRDPTGNLQVYGRDDDKYAESGLKRAGRILSQGLVVAPLTGPASSAAVALPIAARAEQRAASAVDDLAAFERANVPAPPGAFSSAPTRGLVKSVGETPLIGGPINSAIERTYEGLASASQQTARNLGQATTPREAGLSVERGLERFKDARPQDVIEDGFRLPANATPQQVAQSNRVISEVIGAPASATSLKTKQAALYERAWRSIPAEMQAGRSVEGLTRVMQAPANTRQLLNDIVARNARMTVQSGPNAATGPALNPVSGGLLGRMIEAVRNPHWTANLQTLRDMRSSFRRLASGMADTEKNALKASELAGIQSAIGRDMVALLQRNAAAYRQAGDVATAQGFERAVREFAVADRFTRLSMQRLETIEKLFKADSAETLARNITNAAMAGGKGNFDMLRTLSQTLRPEEMNDIRAAIFSELSRPVASARGIVQETGFSAQSMLTRWQSMSDDAKALLFDGEHRRAIDDLVAMSSRLANVESMANVSRSGVNAVNVTGLVAGVGAIAAGNIAGPLQILGGSLAVSYLLSRPLYARWAAQLLQLKSVSAQAPGRLNAEITAHVNRLGEWARRDPELMPIYAAVARENGIKERNQGDDRENEPGGPVQPNDDQSKKPNAPHGRSSSMFGFISPAAAGDEAPPMGDLPGVPFGANGMETTPDSAGARAINEAEAAARAKRALVSAGDTTIVPGVGDMAKGALNAVANAGEAALAFGPMGEALNAPLQAARPVVEAFRSAPRATAAAATTERLIPPPSQAQVLNRLRAETDALMEEAAHLGVTVPPNPAVVRSADGEIAHLTQLRDELAPRIDDLKARVGRVNAEAPPTSGVPVTDARPAMAERNSVLGAVQSNPYVQAVPGQKGFPTKAQQTARATQFFDEGGRIPEGGPWGRDIREAVKFAIEGGGRKGRDGLPAANMPNASEIIEAWRGAQAEAQALREQLAKVEKLSDAPGLSAAEVRERLRQVNLELVDLQQARHAAERAAQPRQGGG